MVVGLTPAQDRVIRTLVSEQRALAKRLDRAERSHDAQRTAIDSGQGIVVKNAEGEPIYRVGQDDSGAVVPEYLAGPTPAQPAPPAVTDELGSLRVELPGIDVNGNPAPRDLRTVQVHASLEEDFEPNAGTLVGSTYDASGVVVAGVQPGIWHLRIIWVTLSGKWSAASPTVTVDVEPLVDVEGIQGAIDDARTELQEAIEARGNRYGQTPPTGTAPEGVVYYRQNALGQTIEVWRSTGTAWVRMPMTDGVFTSISTDKLVAGSSLIGGNLLQNGSITTEKLRVTSSLWAELGQFVTIEAGMIRSNAFVGQTFTGGTFTGSQFQSHAALNRGVKLNESGLYAWNDSGSLSTQLDGKNNLLVGRLQTGLAGTPQVVVAPVYETGNPSVFFSNSGSLAGSQAAIWLGTDGGLNLRPNLESGNNWIGINGGGLRSTGNTPGNQWSLSHIGSFSGRGVRVAQSVEAASLLSTSNNWSVLANGDANFNNTRVWQTFTVSGGVANLDANDVRMRALPSGSFTPNVGWASSPSGRLYKITSNRRVKANIRDLEWDEDAILALRPRTWFDRSLTEYALGKGAVTDSPAGPQVDEDAAVKAGMSRIAGLVAEEVEELGLTELAIYDTDESGNRTLSGVAYDRLVVAVIPIVRGQRDRLNAQQDRIDELEERLSQLEGLLSELT